MIELDPVVASCLPEYGPLRSYMAWAIKTTDAEHLFHLGSVLPCFANEVCEASFRIDAKRQLRPTLWTFLVGVAAGSKSTAQRRAQAHYKRVRNIQAGQQAHDPFIQAEGSLPGIFEALAEAYNPDLDMSAGVVTRDEAARLLDSKDPTVADMLCQIIDGEEVRRHLRSLKAEQRAGATVRDRLRNPAFSGCFATTFARLREVTQASFIEGGLYSRFLWFKGQTCLPNPQLDVDLHEDDWRHAVEDWVDWGRWLLGMCTVLDAESEPRVVQVSGQARDVLEETLFADFVEHARFDDRINATRKRGLTQAVLVAGLYALSRRELIVGAADMAAACNLIAQSTQGLAELNGELAVGDELADVARVRAVITQAGELGIKKSALYPKVQLPKKALDAALAQLIEQEVVVEERTRHQGAGRPGVLYRFVGGARKPAAVRTLRPSSGSPATRPGPSCEHCGGTQADPDSDGLSPCPVCWSANRAG